LGLSFSLGLRKIAIESVELALPEDAVLGDPVCGLLHGLRGEPAMAHATDLVLRDKTGLLENAQMLHNGRQRHVVGMGELGNGRRALGESRDNRPARGVGEGGKGGIQPVLRCDRRILNH